MSEQPAARIPVTGASAAGANPQHSTAILVERHDVAGAQALRVVRLIPVAHEGFGSAIEQVQTVGRGHPEPMGVIFQDGADVVAAQRVRVLRIVAEELHMAAAGVETNESATHRADPQHASLILANGADVRVDEIVGARLIAAESVVRAHPDAAGSIRI